MTFFYNLNKTLDAIRAKPETTHGQLNERDMSRAAKGYEKYVEEGLGDVARKAAGAVGGAVNKAVDRLSGQAAKDAKARERMNRPSLIAQMHGPEGAQNKIDSRNQEQEFDRLSMGDRYGESVDENLGDVARKVGSAVKSGAKALGKAIVGKDDDELLADLKIRAGVRNPENGKPSMAQSNEAAAPMSAKQKSFAALAEPKDKITFADKIAGAKKEVDEMLGDVAAEAMKNALSGGQKKLDKNKNGKLDANDFEMLRKGGKQETDEGWDDMLKDVERRRSATKKGEITHGAKHDIEDTGTGRRVTRRTDPNTGFSVGSDDDKPADGEKRGRGRPKKADKAPERVTSKATKHKGGRKTVEEGDNESDEIKQAMAMLKKAGYEVSKSKHQGMDERKLSSSEKEEREDIVKGMKKSKGDFKKRYGDRGEEVMYATATKMAKERGPGNPDRKKKEKTEESGTVAGSVAPAAGGKAKGGIVGKGIYDSLNRDLEAMISESMNVSVNMSMDENGEPRKNITVSADGEAAEQLAQLLNLAGMPAQDNGHGDCGCGTSPCSCEEELDENQPDWPTNQETIGNDDPLMRRYAGGLNGPKSTGQSVDAPPSLQPQRQGVMGEGADLGMKLYAELKSFKG